MLDNWREQYERILRMRERVMTGDMDDPATQDDLIHLFQDIFHLRDWLINSGVLHRKAVKKAIRNSIYLTICSALANKLKHFNLELKPDIVERKFSTFSVSALITNGTPIPMPSAAWPPTVPETVHPTVPPVMPSKTKDFVIKTPASHPRFKGNEFSCLEAIEHAIQDWETLLRGHGLLT